MSDMTHDLRVLEQCQTLGDFIRPCGRWIEAVPHLDPSLGGISAMVPQLGSRLALAENLAIDVAAFCEESQGASLHKTPELALSHWPAGRSAWFRSPALRSRFQSLVKQADGVHIHGLWEGGTSVAAYTARSLDKPYILSAHGMLDPWAISKKALKKRLYAALVERANLDGAACLHALTMSEAEDYWRFGSRRPIAVIPNGVDLPQTVDTALFLEHYPELQGKRIILFLGRIHFKKGLDLLVQAWSRLAASFPDAVLVLAGPDSQNSRASLETLIADRGLGARVVFTGMLGPRMKWSALASAQCFVLPSYSEGFSVAILEAMGMGLPVVITEQCHLPEVRHAEAGWVIQADALQLSAALEDMLQNSASANAEIGNRGRRLVHQQFSWAVVARQMADLYRWVQGGPRPDTFCCVEVPA